MVFGCAEPPDRSTPKGAFAMIAPCIDRADRRCFFRTLDRESRWSLCTIHRTLLDIRREVESSYPEEKRESAFGLFGEEALTETPEEMFEVYCRDRRCLEKVARGYGAVKHVRHTGADTAEITTTRGQVFRMVRAGGQWGLDLFGDELRTIKVRMIDRLKQVRANAKQYQEQKLAREHESESEK
jgi:hypothetical protein